MITLAVNVGPLVINYFSVPLTFTLGNFFGFVRWIVRIRPAAIENKLLLSKKYYERTNNLSDQINERTKIRYAREASVPPTRNFSC